VQPGVESRTRSGTTGATSTKGARRCRSGLGTGRIETAGARGLANPFWRMTRRSAADSHHTLRGGLPVVVMSALHSGRTTEQLAAAIADCLMPLVNRVAASVMRSYSGRYGSPWRRC
jgi:hypothetical protein